MLIIKVILFLIRIQILVQLSFFCNWSGSSSGTDHKRSDSVDRKQNPEDYVGIRILHNIGLHQSRKLVSNVQLFNCVFFLKISVTKSINKRQKLGIHTCLKTVLPSSASSLVNLSLKKGLESDKRGHKIQ